MLIDGSTLGSLEALAAGTLAGGARGLLAEGEAGADRQMMALIAVSVLLILLVVVLAMLGRAIKKARPQPTAASAPGIDPSKAGIDPSKETAPTATQEEIDLTRMRVFTPDLLPKLSFDENEDEDSPAVEESKPSLIYDGDAWVGIDEPTGSHELISTAAAGASDRGLKRNKNEDAWLVDAALDLYVVADGMGGYAGGDVAANMTVAEIRRSLEAGKPPTTTNVVEKSPLRGRELVEAIEKANAVVNGLSGARSELAGMGTTILATRFSRKKQRLFCAHVGDSRLYRFRAGTLQQLTVDHTLGAKGVTGPLASNVRRAIGVHPTVLVDLLVDKPLPNDLYLLCSDGMYKMLNKEETSALLSAKRSQRLTQADLQEMAGSIIKAANAAGGKDNISVVLVSIGTPA